MSIQTRVNQLFAYWKAAFPQLNSSPGTVASAIGSGVGLLQNDADVLLASVQNASLISSATGDNLDALASDRGVTRLQPSLAAGTITLTRSDTTTPLSGPAGITVSTRNVDPTTNVYFTTTAGYSFGIGQATASIAAMANIPGTSGNVAVGTITNIVTLIQGVISVTNNATFSGGVDRENDESLRQRIFAALLPQNSTTKLQASVLGITGIASAAVFDQQDFNGNFLVYANDISGSLYTTQKNLVTTTVNAQKPLGTTGTVLSPTMTLLTVTYQFAVNPGWSVATVQAALNAAIIQYFNALTIGQTFRPYDLMAQIFGNVPGKQAVPGVMNFIVTLPITSQTPLPWQIYRPGAITGSQIAN